MSTPLPMPTWEELDASDRRRRARLLKLSMENIARVLSNDDGLRRLAEIADDEWIAAQDDDSHAAA